MSPSAMTSDHVFISDAFDGGNIEHVETILSGDDGSIIINLKIKPDPYTELEKKHHFQYFSFRSLISHPQFPPPSSLTTSSSSPKKQSTKYVIINAGDASYANAWPNTTTCFSRNNDSWRRVLNTQYDASTGHLFWTFEHSFGESVHFSYFPPYSYQDHLELVAKCCDSPSAKVTSLGKTLDGREMDCVITGTGDKTAWVIHRQHPGENMAEYFAEGLLSRLLGLRANNSLDGLTHKALSQYTFYIVPNMNPDGSVRGHLRTNAAGTNLNREWHPSQITPVADADNGSNTYDAPTLKRSPEVYHVLNAMDKTGVDVFIDVHGDEALPYNFVSGMEGCPNWGPRLRSLQGAFVASYARANGDMQAVFGYEPDEPGKGKLNICSNQIAARFDCLGVTLEMPFKDCASNPDPERGWSGDRAKMLGASSLDAMVYVAPYLRAKGDFWTEFKEEDAYICPKDN